MGASMAEQLSNALKSAQDKMAQNSPEGRALGVLREELAGILRVPPAAPHVPKALGRRPTPLRYWMDTCKVGDTFVYHTSGNGSNVTSVAKEAGVKVRTETIVMVSGTFSAPVVSPAVLVTMAEKDGKTLQDTVASL